MGPSFQNPSPLSSFGNLEQHWERTESWVVKITSHKFDHCKYQWSAYCAGHDAACFPCPIALYLHQIPKSNCFCSSCSQMRCWRLEGAKGLTIGHTGGKWYRQDSNPPLSDSRPPRGMSGVGREADWVQMLSLSLRLGSPVSESRSPRLRIHDFLRSG